MISMIFNLVQRNKNRAISLWIIGIFLGLAIVTGVAQYFGGENLAADVPETGRVESTAPSAADMPSPVPKKVTTLRVIREGYAGKRMSYPSRLFVDRVSKEIYVTDSGNSRILVFTYDFYPLLSIGKSDGVEVPGGVAVDGHGTLYVAQAPGRKVARPRISVFSPSLQWQKDIFMDGFEGSDAFQPRNLAIHPSGRLFVAGGYRGVVVLNPSGAFSHLISPVDAVAKEEPARATICDVEIDTAGKIYLLSEDMGRVYVYDAAEKFLFKFGKKGGSTGKLSRPRGLGIDPRTGNIYVIDYMRHTANAYSKTGRFLYEFGGKGWAPGWFQFPSDIQVDFSGHVLVADTFNNRVQVLGME